jgi:beta-lactamase regulating signal transducer with metallopeptidase domain
MSASWGSLPLFAVALAVALAIGATAAACVVAGLRRRLLQCDPVTRHRALLLLTALPLVVGLALTLSASLPALVSLVVPSIDHCDLHDDEHAHLCLQHGPRALAPAVLPVLGVLVALALFRVARAGVRIVRARRLVRALVASGEDDTGRGITLVDTTLPICMVAGLRRPRIVVARELAARVEPEQLEIMLAHERSHVRRRDALVSVLARALCSLHVPSIGRWLSRELAIAAEQACDEAAARETGDRDAVAATIVAMQRAWLVHGTARIATVGHGFAMHALERRVRSLLDDPVAARSLAVPTWCLAGLVVVTLAATSVLHHVAESALSHLAM